jgi:hypothetical protein
MREFVVRYLRDVASMALLGAVVAGIVGGLSAAVDLHVVGAIMGAIVGIGTTLARR